MPQIYIQNYKEQFLRNDQNVLNHSFFHNQKNFKFFLGGGGASQSSDEVSSGSWNILRGEKYIWLW